MGYSIYFGPVNCIVLFDMQWIDPDCHARTSRHYDPEVFYLKFEPNLHSNRTGATSEQWFSERYSKLKQEINQLDNVNGHGSFLLLNFLLDLKNSEIYEAKNRELYKNTWLRGEEKLSYMVYLDESMFHSTKIELDSGNTFSTTDFTLAPTETIPVWVGYHYKDVLRIGDTFSISWFGDKLQYRVVGVMAKGSKWLDKMITFQRGLET